MSAINFNPIDALIESVKTPGKFTDSDKYRLWQSIKALSDALVRVDQIDSSILTIETPSGVINGANKLFMLMNKPIGGTLLAGYKNGLLLKQGTDFIMKDNLITFIVAPAALSVIQFIYSYAS